jgi:hypothetical protein
MDIDDFRLKHMIRAFADCAVETSSKAMQDMINHIAIEKKENGGTDYCDIWLAEAICNLMKHTVNHVLTSENFRAIGNIPNIPKEQVQLASGILEIAADEFSEEYLGFVKRKNLKTAAEHIKALKAVEIYLTKEAYSEFCEKIYNKLREKEDE